MAGDAKRGCVVVFLLLIMCQIWLTVFLFCILAVGLSWNTKYRKYKFSLLLWSQWEKKYIFFLHMCRWRSAISPLLTNLCLSVKLAIHKITSDDNYFPELLFIQLVQGRHVATRNFQGCIHMIWSYSVFMQQFSQNHSKTIVFYRDVKMFYH